MILKVQAISFVSASITIFFSKKVTRTCYVHLVTGPKTEQKIPFCPFLIIKSNIGRDFVSPERWREKIFQIDFVGVATRFHGSVPIRPMRRKYVKIIFSRIYRSSLLSSTDNQMRWYLSKFILYYGRSMPHHTTPYHITQTEHWLCIRQYQNVLERT